MTTSKVTTERLSDRLQLLIRTDEIPLSDAWGKLIDGVKSMESELLAAREAQSNQMKPAGFIQAKGNGYDTFELKAFYGNNLQCGDKLFTAPPAPAVTKLPDFGALTKLIVGRLIDYGTANDDAIADAEVFVYNACRAAMLNHSGDSNEKVPAGFKLVPVESNDAWAERYCELTNKHPDGGLTTYIGDGAVTITFREKSKREIDAMLAAAPTPTEQP